MLRPISAVAFLAIVLVSSVTRAESPSVYVEQVSCEGGPFGLRLPPHLPEVMKLGSIAREEIQQIEKWDGYSTTRKYIEFSGFTLGLVTFSNDPNRYMVSFAEITSSRWSHIAPFRVGESVKSVRRKLGSSAASDPELKAKYGSEGGDVSFQYAHGKITKVVYACYTG